MLFDVVTWIGWMQIICKIIIIVHGVLMFHVAFIYTCNMKENALASCISYTRSHHVELSVGAWSCLFTSVGEWVVSSENGTWTLWSGQLWP